jgi:VWFA-related protein
MQTPAKPAAWLGIVLIALLVMVGHAAPVLATDAARQVMPTVRITSPLGRTGTPATIRIVAQIEWPSADDGRAALHVVFSVDGNPVGMVDSGPPYAVTWNDDNPFEAREIAVEASDAMGRSARDDVKLPAFDLTDRTEVRSIVVEAGVYDEHGRSVSTLQPTDFVLRENGQTQTLDLVKPETLPTTTLLLIDSSQSMAGRFDAVRHATAQVARALEAQDKVLIAPFNQHLGAVTGPTNDAATIEQSVDAMKAGGGTAILNALQDGVRLLDGIEGRRSIILVTDGFDENSTIDAATATTAVEGAQITIYTVAMGGVTGVSLVGERLLRHLTEATGGHAFFPWRDADLTSVAKQVADDAHSRYLITYTPINQEKDGTWRSIALEVPSGYHTRARAGYQASLPPPIRPTIEFTVRDRTLSYIDDIAVNDLEVNEDGVPQRIDTFQEAVDPVSIALLLDASGSMVRATETVKQTAREFVAAVRPEDSLALVTFADEPHFAHAFGTDRHQTLDAVDTYVAAGGTALYDALWNTLTNLKTVQGRRAIVILTDGRDENNASTGPGSAHGLDEVLELGRQVGAAIFPIGLGTRVDRSVLVKLAEESGGDAYFSSDPSELSAQFQNIVENLRRRYLLSYTSTNMHADGQWRHVDIHSPTRALVVRSTGGYFAPD